MTLGYVGDNRDPYWWPASGTFEVVVGAVLTQNTNWTNVEKALLNLKNPHVLSLSEIAHIETEKLAELIRPSGFYNVKSKRLQTLCRNIEETFGDFEMFCQMVERDWLLSQKGLGRESADAILCYACLKEEMVVDAYTARLLSGLGCEMNDYEEIKAWCVNGLEGTERKVEMLYGRKMSKTEVYARLHGKIVEYVKEHSKRKQVDTTPLLEAYAKLS